MTGIAIDHRNRRVGLLALLGALAMLGVGYAAVPLYDLFCKVTGFGGTTQRASEAQAAAVRVLDRTITVRFDANLQRGMPWKFEPVQVTQELPLGGRKMALYRSENLSDRPIKGIATFNVTPLVAGKYFNKIQCFCFNEQTLQPGQAVDMPVVYYVDPAILDDPDAKGIEEITLSYTFHPVAEEAPKALDRANPAR